MNRNFEDRKSRKVYLKSKENNAIIKALNMYGRVPEQWELLEEIERLNNIINELEKWLNEKICLNKNDKDYINGMTFVGVNLQMYQMFLDKLQELKGSNDPSYEEMVGFVEKVCKDIKSQPTLHEELEEERKTIAKIVGDFEEVNK